jgi:hypothetical protein
MRVFRAGLSNLEEAHTQCSLWGFSFAGLYVPNEICPSTYAMLKLKTVVATQKCVPRSFQHLKCALNKHVFTLLAFDNPSEVKPECDFATCRLAALRRIRRRLYFASCHNKHLFILFVKATRPRSTPTSHPLETNPAHTKMRTSLFVLLVIGIAGSLLSLALKAAQVRSLSLAWNPQAAPH